MLSTSVSMRGFNIASVIGGSSVRLVCATRSYRRFADDRREAARSLRRYLGRASRAASLPLTYTTTRNTT
jgi:hypothetical protein